MAGLVLLGIVFLCVIESIVDANFPINVQCGSSSNYRWLNLVQPQGISNCGYTIKPFGVFVCQLKVEFTTNLPNPVNPTIDRAPECPPDNIIVIGKFRICGRNTNQHVYLEFDGSDLSNRASISASVTSGTYFIKVTQIICPLGVRRGRNQIGGTQSLLAGLVTPALVDQYLVAPAACDQYFISNSGFVESFGFDFGRGQYPADFQYNVCFQTLSSASKLSLTGVDFELEYFLPLQVDGDCDDENFMPGDFIRLPAPGRIGTSQQMNTRFCGTVLKGKTVESNIFGTAMFTFNAGTYRGLNGVAKRIFRLQYSVT